MKSLLTALVALCSAVAPGFGQTYSFSLQGDREVGAPGDPDGWGHAVVTLDAGRVYYFLWVKDIATPTAAHIHAGRAGVNGPVRVDFTPNFTNSGGGVFQAMGSVAADAQVLSAIVGDPAAFYVNVHNGEFPAGALRGQLLGEGAAARAIATDLRGAREVPTPGDGDGLGHATVLRDGANLVYYLWAKNVAPPTAAHIHAGAAGANGPVIIGFSGLAWTDAQAAGTVSADAGQLEAIWRTPEEFYVNIHNADFPAGAVRGQLGPSETTLYLPVVARNPGQGSSVFVTDLRLLNLADTDAEVFVSWFPKGSAGAQGPAAVTRVVVVAAGEAVINDVVGTLFQANDRGALAISSSAPLRAAARTFNDQRAAGSGTYGQFVQGLGREQAHRAGALLLSSHRPRGDGRDFRLNAGYFNPNPFPVQVTFNVRTPDGRAVAPPGERTLGPWANDLGAYHSMIPGIPAAAQAQPAFFITYTAAAPVFIYSSLVDNLTDDGLHEPAQPIPAALVSRPNQPPNGVITSPAGDVTITAGQSVSFAGQANDPDGDPVSVLWSFGDGRTSTQLNPGSVTYPAVGTFTVTLTATDSRGLADPTPDSRTITVTAPANRPPDGVITSPPGDVTITAGQSVSFAGQATDPDGDPVTVLWSFGDGVTSTQLNPGPHTYVTPGVYSVTFTATDSKGLSDPTPDTRTVTVNPAPTATLSRVQNEIFDRFCMGCHPPNAGLDLERGNSHGNLVNVPSSQQPALLLVKPGDPDNSYLYRKIVGGPGISGSRMPQGGPFLSTERTQLLRDWILAGAPNN